MKKILNICLLIAALFCATPAFAEPDQWTISTGYNYSSGDYGQTESTKVHYAPVTLKWRHGKWTLKLMAPYISITGPGVVVGDVPVGAPRPVGTESGLGDVTATVDYMHTLNAKGTTLNLTGIVKLPTADEDRRLGTGLTDFTAQAGVIQPIGKFFVMGNVGRKFNGSNASFPLDDVWKFTAGGGYNIDDKTSVGALFDYREKQSAAGDPMELATAYVSRKFDDGLSVQLYASAGFTDAAPNGAIGIQFNKEFNLF
jgi:hypothetical protein